MIRVIGSFQNIIKNMKKGKLLFARREEDIHFRENVHVYYVVHFWNLFNRFSNTSNTVTQKPQGTYSLFRYAPIQSKYMLYKKDYEFIFS